MSDSFTEVTTQGWGSRIMESIKGILAGIVLFVVAFPVLFLNEGCAVRTYKMLKEGAGACISLAEPKVEAANDGKLVHFTADAVTEDTLTDAELGAEATAIRLERRVEMYQWKERKKSKSKKNLGGSKTTKTTYHYDRVWSSELINSSKFKKAEAHRNPTSMPYSSKTFTAQNVTAGGFNLSSSLINKIKGETDMAIDESMVAKLPPALTAKGQVQGKDFYVGTDPSNPQIGDLRLSFTVVRPPQKISVISQQSGNTLVPYQSKAGPTLERLQMGAHSKDAMFEQAQAENKTRTWIVRVVGFVIMAVGLMLVFKPISVVANVVPFLGSIVGAGFALAAFGIAFALSLITIAVAWVFYRPLLGIPLLIVGVAAIVLVIVKGAKAKAARRPTTAS